MKKIRIGINGTGRIGRTVLREIFNLNHPLLEVVAINNPGPQERYIHLIKYDSNHGKFSKPIFYADGTLTIDNKKVAFFNFSDPQDIPWDKESVDLVIDSTGIFKDKNTLAKHLKGSVKKVMMCAPGKNLDGTFVMGVNHQNYDTKKHHIFSNASCTTNCLAPIAKVINEKFGIENGLMTTVHSYTLDQSILDSSHKDPRRARAGAVSIIPTSTGAAKTIGLIIPELNGKLDGFSLRVPTPNVSLVDFSVNLKKTASIEEINHVLKEAAHGYLKGILDYTEEELVSIDYMSNPNSSIVDAKLTNVVGNMAKIVCWYDNEFGFSRRVIDLAAYAGERM